MLLSVLAHEKSTIFLLVYGSSVLPSGLKIDTELIGLYVHPSIPLDAEVLRARLIINQPSGTSQMRLLCTGLSQITGVYCASTKFVRFQSGAWSTRRRLHVMHGRT